ncbi:MAG: HEAT repeat domain-containing protein [Vicinamibacteria bacterium]|nr:HEAT repeat domain-containing protein [Vicinamibacteria bacterium]
MRDLEALVDHYLTEWSSSGWAHAFHSLVELGPVALSELEKRFSSTRDDALRAEIVVIVRHLHTDLSVPLFEAALADRSPEVWKAALDGLVDLASPEAIALLERSRTQPPAGTAEAEWESWVSEALDQARDQDATRV